MHSVVDSCMSPDWGGTLNLGVSGRHSNQLSYLARTRKDLFTQDTEVQIIKENSDILAML